MSYELQQKRAKEENEARLVKSSENVVGEGEPNKRQKVE
jgi:hypothetical protein